MSEPLFDPMMVLVGLVAVFAIYGAGILVSKLIDRIFHKWNDK